MAILIHAFQLWHNTRIIGKFRTPAALPQAAKSRYFMDRNLSGPQISTNVFELNMGLCLETKRLLISRDSDDMTRC